MSSILYINHTSILLPYGASTSLRQNLNVFFDQFDRTYLLSPYSPDTSLPPGITNAFKLNPPILYNYDGAPVQGFAIITFLSSLHKAFVATYKLLLFRLSHDINIIHLNSFVLAPLCPILRLIFPKSRIVLVVREFVARKNAWTSFFIQFPDSLIFIDSSVKSRFYFLYPRYYHPCITIPNLVSVSQNKLSLAAICPSLSLNTPSIVFAFIGRVEDKSKGFEFVLRCFLRHILDFPSSRLLVISSISPKYHAYIQAEFSPPPSSVFFLGEIPELSSTGIYNSIHCTLRGEHCYRPGRTVLESAAHGAYCLIPGNYDELLQDPSLIGYRDYVCLYSPRNFDSLLAGLGKVCSVDRLKSTPPSTDYSSYCFEYSKVYNADNPSYNG